MHIQHKTVIFQLLIKFNKLFIIKKWFECNFPWDLVGGKTDMFYIFFFSEQEFFICS